MNTLPRAITAHWFTNPNDYWLLRSRWRALLASGQRHTLTASHHLLYNALLGRDWRRGFTPPRNTRKLANGAFDGWALWRALGALHSSQPDALLAPFDGRVTVEMLAQLRRALPRVRYFDLKVEQFGGGAFPFDAYIPPAEWLPAAEGTETGRA